MLLRRPSGGCAHRSGKSTTEDKTRHAHPKGRFLVFFWGRGWGRATQRQRCVRGAIWKEGTQQQNTRAPSTRAGVCVVVAALSPHTNKSPSPRRAQHRCRRCGAHSQHKKKEANGCNKQKQAKKRKGADLLQHSTKGAARGAASPLPATRLGKQTRALRLPLSHSATRPSQLAGAVLLWWWRRPRRQVVVLGGGCIVLCLV